MQEPVHWEEEPIQLTENIDTPKLLIGTCALVLGAVIYLSDRSPGSVYFIQGPMEHLSFYSGERTLFGVAGNHLPSFFHVFSFSLLCSAFIPGKVYQGSLVCVFWFLVNTLFELGQKFPDQAASFVPTWFSRFPFFENTASFFRNGTYDPWDIVFFALGAGSACAVLWVLKKRSWLR